MNTSDTGSIRRLAIAGIVGGTLTALSGFVVQAIVRPASDVSDEMWSFPWTADALVPVSVLYAALHVLICLGLIGFLRSGLAGTGRAGRVGPIISVAGTALLGIAELASIPVSDQRMDETGATLVGAFFGVANLIAAAGLLITGIATVRAGRWLGWRRFMPLATGIALAVVLGLAMTPLLAAGITVYGIGVLAWNVGLYTQPAPSPAAVSLAPAAHAV